jgi:uncharacterized protein YjiS (DUF1127 family)
VPIVEDTEGTIMSRTASTAAGSRRGDTFLTRFLIAAADMVLEWSERSRQRCTLDTLDDHLLRDIGLTHVDVIVERSKPFWRR